jgi:hypothetical protein
MKTELEAVYHILNVARAAEHNNDEPTTERLVRSMLQNHRADSLRKFYKDGHYVDDEVFQKIPIEVTKDSNGDFKVEIPKAIRFEHHAGFYLEKNEIPIPVITSQQYRLNKNNPFGKNFLFAKTEEQLLTLFVADVSTIQNPDIYSENYLFLKAIQDEILIAEIYNFNNPGSQLPTKLNLNYHAVLLNPSDDPNYDWEIDNYPFPSERLFELATQVLAKEFGIMTASKKDEVQNAKGDENKNSNNAQRNTGQQE